METVKAALFDVDGVLLDTEVFQYLAWADTLKEYTGQELSEQEYSQEYCGNASTLIAEQIQKRFRPDLTPEEILETRERRVVEKVRTGKIMQMPYAAAVLEYFARKIPTALATGAAAEENAIKLQRSGLDAIIKRYDIPIISRDMVAHSKPAPDTYILAAKTLGIAPAECIAFEDTVAGIQSAESAGTVCLAVPNKWTVHQMPKGRATYANLQRAAQFVNRNYLLQPSR